MVMQETSSENCTLICQPLQSLQEFEVDNKKKYAQLILNFFWVVYLNFSFYGFINISLRCIWIDTL